LAGAGKVMTLHSESWIESWLQIVGAPESTGHSCWHIPQEVATVGGCPSCSCCPSAPASQPSQQGTGKAAALMSRLSQNQSPRRSPFASLPAASSAAAPLPPAAVALGARPQRWHPLLPAALTEPLQQRMVGGTAQAGW